MSELEISMAIQVLPREIAEKIAAGEVIERPASVIKELVENAIDAGANTIRVFIEDGGRKRLRIEDDGCGIPYEEMPLALERHATSKIQSIDDLWNIHTLGFRGEALPSIAAISRFTLESRPTSETGRKLYLEGGRLIRDTAIEVQNRLRKETGTTVSVEDLFFNLPARLKFQKSKNSEASAIRELLERLALSHPKISFQLTSDSRKTLSLSAVTNVIDRVADVLEAKPEHLSEFDQRYENLRVYGWLDQNARGANSRALYLAVNRRMVRDRLLQQAVMTALRPQMMEGEYPKIFLNVEIAPEDIDVNVHPAKSEVRFRNSRDVFSLIHAALSALAVNADRVAYDIPIPAPSQPAHQNSRGFAPAATPTLFQQSALGHVFQTKTYESPRFEFQASQALPGASPPASPPKESPFQTLHYIGQLKNTYLLFQDGDGLVLIDQHAAHERINYEKIRNEFLSTGLRSQPLLISATLKCRPEDVALALDHSDTLAKLGFEFEAFGEDCLLIRSTPEGVEADQTLEFFKVVLDELKSAEENDFLVKDPSRLSPKLERMLSTSACHSSVRAGQALSAHEAQDLARQMETTASALNCPHGRPASIRVSFSQIEGWFKR